ncbi:MAG TPA: M18 family aminopeptidase [Candidatus Limnocylindrales bacterium]|nr:M18 family aminopeptidase [Candidatus Limnocylindrales bacterium]
MSEVVDLMVFLDNSPTPYHAVAEAAQRLEAAGFRRLREEDSWDVAAGDRCYVERGGGSLIAFEIGSSDPADAGFRIIGTHTDSPNLRIKPHADVRSHGYRQLAVEPYGGVLLHTWLDRDLGLAGRVSVAAGEEPATVLINFRRPIARIPNLAIHLFRELRSDGLKLNEQNHLPPLMGLESGPELAALIVEQFENTGEDAIDAEDILGFDLMLYDLQTAAIGGASDDFLFSARLDNLCSTHSAITAIVRASQKTAKSPFTRVIALHDHEEVGSRSATGAGGPFLLDVVDRISAVVGKNDSEAKARALARSRMVSADMAHALHPNYADRHEAGHRPMIGGGPVLKFNAGQSYATDAETAAMFASVCRRADVKLQQYVTRSDMGCGSTIGPVSAARVGIRTVDVGTPMMSMHSCREMLGTADVAPMIRALTTFLEAAE